MLITNDNGIHYFKTNEPADHRPRIAGGLMTVANHRTNGLRMRERATENMSSEVMHSLSFSPFILSSHGSTDAFGTHTICGDVSIHGNHVVTLQSDIGVWRTLKLRAVYCA